MMNVSDKQQNRFWFAGDVTMENMTDYYFSMFEVPSCDYYHPVTGDCVATLEEFRKAIVVWLTPKPYVAALMVLFVCTFLLGIFGNFLVCLVVWKNQRMKTVTNTFIFNLAVADFMVLLIALPFTLIQDVAQTWFFGNVMCKLVKYTQRVSVVVSVLTLTAIAIERFNAICYPLKARATLVKARFTIVVIWIIAFSASIPDLVFCEIKRSYPEYVTPYLVSCRSMKPLMGFYIYIIVFFVIPVIIIAFCYARIAKCLWKSHIPIQAGNGSSTSFGESSQPQAPRRRTAKMLFVVVLFFFCCYLPVNIINTLFILQLTGMVKSAWTLGAHSTVIIVMCTHLLVYVNSAMNPVIYNFMSEKFRREFRIACSSCCAKRARCPMAVELTEKRDNFTRTGTTRLVTSADNRGTFV